MATTQTLEERTKAISDLDLSGFQTKAESFAGTTQKVIDSRPKAYGTGKQILGAIAGIFGGNPVKEAEAKEQAQYQASVSNALYSGSKLTNQIQGQGEQIASQSLGIQKEFQEQAQKQLENIQKQTLEQYERGLYNGQTVQEVSSAQRAARVGFANEAANQQKASLFRENEYQQQQAQSQGGQAMLRERQLTGARGIGGSSVEDQILNRQRTETVASQGQAQEKLGQGLFEVNEQHSKQIAEINAEINKNAQTMQQQAMKGKDTQDEQTRQNIIEQQQAGITQVQNAYLTKRKEIDKLTSEISMQLDKLKAES